MSPITPQEAWDATDPSHTDEQRKVSAEAIITGVAANDAYIASRGELEQLVLHARGGQVPPTHEALNSPPKEDESIEGSSVEDEPTVLTPGVAPASADAGAPGPENSTAAVSALRAQLEAAGMKPEA